MLPALWSPPLKVARVTRLYDGLIVAMTIAWLANFYLEIRHSPVHLLRAAAPPLLAIIALAFLLRGIIRSESARRGSADLHVSAWRWSVVAAACAGVIAALLIGIHFGR